MQKFIELIEQMPLTKTNPPTNTIAHIFHHEQKENFISDWLAFLINPEYTGSTEPLTALLKLAVGTEQIDISDVSIFREYTFEDQRRIDFLIETGDYLIGIENKIWSDLQDRQLEDYKAQLSSPKVLNGRQLILILLYPKRNSSLPTNSPEHLHSFLTVTYEDLIDEFKKIRFSIFENLRATVMMEDFILHMEEYIMAESNKSTVNLDMWHFETAYQDKLHTLKASLKESKEQFSKYIADRMHQIVKDQGGGDEWNIATYNTYFQLYKSGWENHQVHFELLKQDEFAAREFDVVLHTNERKKIARTKALSSLEFEAGKKTFPISYASQADFERTMDAVFSELDAMVAKYTGIIDMEIAKSSVL